MVDYGNVLLGSILVVTFISTAEALKQTLLKAQSIASIPASATGTQLANIYERLGITEQMKAKNHEQPGPSSSLRRSPTSVVGPGATCAHTAASLQTSSGTTPRSSGIPLVAILISCGVVP